MRPTTQELQALSYGTIRPKSPRFGGGRQPRKWAIQQSTIRQAGRYLPGERQARRLQGAQDGLRGITPDDRQAASRGSAEGRAHGPRHSP
jgi:hypothetical protein